MKRLTNKKVVILLAVICLLAMGCKKTQEVRYEPNDGNGNYLYGYSNGAFAYKKINGAQHEKLFAESYVQVLKNPQDPTHVLRESNSDIWVYVNFGGPGGTTTIEDNSCTTSSPSRCSIRVNFDDWYRSGNDASAVLCALNGSGYASGAGLSGGATVGFRHWICKNQKLSFLIP